MELVNFYSELVDKREIRIEKRLGECHEIIRDSRITNRLQARAFPNSIKVFCNGLLQLSGENFEEIHDQNGSYVHFSQQPYSGDIIQIFYQGYTAKGDDYRWN